MAAVSTLKEYQTPKFCVKKVINIKGICYASTKAQRS